MRINRFSRALGSTALGLTLALTVAACGSSDDAGSSSASATEHNDADVAFSTDMLQHHAQALTMVDLTEGRTLDPEVKALADEIRAAQTPEIQSFTGWLKDWNEKVPATDDHAMDGSMDGMDTSMPGMMSAESMTALENAPDATFQSMWLGMMVEHHTGAVEMAKTEQQDGQYQPALDLADSIITSQTKEIATMKALLS